MLTLQTASAGSGKTYTLAKEFIKNYLFATSPETGKLRLRTEKELPDALRGILAITFTNMATEEMKQRIIEKLDALAFSTAPDKDIDYLEEFITDTSAPRSAISRLAKAALSVLLSEYSSFNISTIDSFFQSVLRTFAYEVDLNDAYQVELDSEYVSKVGLDLLLDSINSHDSGSSETEYWIRHLMARNITSGKAWNIFSKSESSESIYLELIGVAKKMESEDFKEVSAKLEEYFESGNDFKNFTEILFTRYGEPLLNLGQQCFKLSRNIRKELHSLGIKDIKAGNSRLDTILGRSASYRFALPNLEPFPRFNIDGAITIITDTEETKYKNFDDAPFSCANLQSLIRELLQKGAEYFNLYSDVPTQCWMAYSQHFAHLALMMEINRLGKEYLENNNSVQLSDTNTILKKIISDDDTPFVYERLGTRLNHYLIDEFQDTSRMQWHNLRPLLAESNSRGNANLIIGDPKQSIYRFRNADPGIITTLVPQTFSDRRDKGNTPGENSNYRSDRRMVRFNNSIFHLLADVVDSKLKLESSSPLSFHNLYINAPQIPADKTDNGYIEIRFDPNKAESEKEYIAETFGPLVTSLLKRGYNQKEICFLVRTNDQGQALIEGLTQYNLSLPETEEKIEFVSEQSLKISLSPAIRIIVTALRAISGGASSLRRDVTDDNTSDKKKNIEKISAAFHFFAARHRDLSPAQCLEQFLKNNDTDDVILQLLSSLQTVALPSLVEAIASEFLTEEMITENAPFIAAFQDIVLEYCENETADVSSFLSWWETRCNTASIASPASANAVRIMTIHKAKGLEYNVVIIPFGDHNISNARDEWRWVEPDLLASENTDLIFPSFLPVSTSHVKTTPHQHLKTELSRMHAMDILNSVYVAFTRARHELYVFSNLSWRETKSGYSLSSPNTLGALLWNILTKYESTLPVPFDTDIFLAPEEINLSDTDPVNELTILQIGVKPDTKTIENFHRKEAEKKAKTYNAPPEVSHTNYTLNTHSPVLTFKPEKEYSSETESIRSEGTLLHELMQEILAISDIDKAFLKMKISGKMSKTQLSEAWKIINDAIEFSKSDPRSIHWFDGTMQIINERDIILPSRDSKTQAHLYRPDRIMLAPDDSVIVVDYKFGTEADVDTRKTYERKTRRYASLLKQAGIPGKCFIPVVWYVKNNEMVFLNPI